MLYLGIESVTLFHFWQIADACTICFCSTASMTKSWVARSQAHTSCLLCGNSRNLNHHWINHELVKSLFTLFAPNFVSTNVTGRKISTIKGAKSQIFVLKILSSVSFKGQHLCLSNRTSTKTNGCKLCCSFTVCFYASSSFLGELCCKRFQNENRSVNLCTE